MHNYEARPDKDHRSVDRISYAVPIGRFVVRRAERSRQCIGYAKHRSSLYDAVIRVYDDAGNLIDMHEHAGQFKEP